MNTLKIKKLHPKAIVPKYATPGAGAFDLHAINVPTGCITVYSGAPVVFDTGLAFEVPEGYAMLILSRSGSGFKNDTRLANCEGLVDADFRGQVRVKLTRDPANSEPMAVKEGDRIAQAIIVKADQWAFEVVDELSETERGEGGFGSTGK